MATLTQMPVNTAEITRRREQLTLSMDQAAARADKLVRSWGYKTGFRRQRWWDIESGRYGDPRISTLEAVAIVLECTIIDLLIPTARKGARR